MPSPFPGMDPYLENPGLWPDVHHRLITIASDLLTTQLRPRYYVRIEERVYVSDEYDPGRAVLIPDMRIAARTRGGGGRGKDSGAGVAAVVEPVIATTMIEEEIHESRLEIIDREFRSVVTVVEILSPSNKVAGSRGEKSYREKRHDIMHSPSHLVEIDLLREGARIESQEALPPHEYLVHVSSVEHRPKGKLWPIPIESPLPTIDVPLRGDDGPAQLDLQEVLATAYDRAAYDLEIDYSAPPVPPLSPRLAEWADRLLREKQVRQQP